MKEIEELFRKLRHHYRLFLKGSNDSFIKMNEIETDLLSRFRELEKDRDCAVQCWKDEKAENIRLKEMLE